MSSANLHESRGGDLVRVPLGSARAALGGSASFLGLMILMGLSFFHGSRFPAQGGPQGPPHWRGPRRARGSLGRRRGPCRVALCLTPCFCHLRGFLCEMCLTEEWKRRNQCPLRRFLFCLHKWQTSFAKASCQRIKPASSTAPRASKQCSLPDPLQLHHCSTAHLQSRGPKFRCCLILEGETWQLLCCMGLCPRQGLAACVSL